MAFVTDDLTGPVWGDWALYLASLLRAFENDLGVQASVGFWDQAGFAADDDTESFARRRQTETKHGRSALLAAMGYITPELTGKQPDYLSPSTSLTVADVPNGLAAISKEPAAVGFKVLTSFDPAAKTVKQTAKHPCRLARRAIIGTLFQDGLADLAWGDWALHTAPPLHSFENELSAQAPGGCWDPTGFAANGSTGNFARRRRTEIKHGRVARTAAMGHITPEIPGKLPGYLSPSAGLKFANVPHGLAAPSKVPAAGWGQIHAYVAFREAPQDQSPGTATAAKLAEAMMAIIGTLSRDGLFGSAWGDWLRPPVDDKTSSLQTLQ
jgi:hypothetical protein